MREAQRKEANGANDVNQIDEHETDQKTAGEARAEVGEKRQRNHSVSGGSREAEGARQESTHSNMTENGANMEGIATVTSFY